MTSETTTNSGSNKHQNQTDDDEEEDEPVYIESSPCSRWQKRRETVRILLIASNNLHDLFS